MRPYRLGLTLAGALLCAALLALAPATAGAAASASATPFTPSLLAGTWEGSWRNETFNTTGAARIVASAPGDTRLNFTVDLGGNVFGCADPPPATDGIPKGTGPNTWNEKGFQIKRSGSLGSQLLTYDHAKRTLTGTGTNPTCLFGLEWSIAGRFDSTRFSGTISIKLPDGTPATSKLELVQTPAPGAASTGATAGGAADRTPPTVTVRAMTGARPGPVRLAWQAADASGKATFVVTVAPQSVSGAPGAPVLTRTLRAQAVGTKQPTGHSILWTPGAAKPGTYRVCVRATDARGNQGAAACATLRLA